MPTRSLDIIQIAEPCTRSWNAMTGDDRACFCKHCQKHVYDLSAMSTDEAERLVCKNAGTLCVRFQTGPDGRPITLDYAASPRRNRWLWPVTIIGACLSAAAGVAYLNKPAPVMMGMMPSPLTMPTTNPAVPAKTSCTSPASS